jgi:hypothetical protein
MVPDERFGGQDEAAHFRRWQPPERAARAENPDAWSDLGEPYEGAVVLYDLQSGRATPGSATRIIGRYAAVRFLRLATHAQGARGGIDAERRIAASYTAALRAPPEEARALRAIVELARPEPPRRIMAFLNVAAASAAGSREPWGAFALHREAYRLGTARGWLREAASAAESIGVLARAAGRQRAHRLWRLRARLLSRQETAVTPGAGEG